MVEGHGRVPNKHREAFKARLQAQLRACALSDVAYDSDSDDGVSDSQQIVDPFSAAVSISSSSARQSSNTRILSFLERLRNTLQSNMTDLQKQQQPSSP